MKYMFESEVAAIVGSDAAVLFQNIGHWVMVAKANNRNFRDGKYWVYNTFHAWQELFQYLSLRQIRYALEKLQDAGLIESGCFNEDRRDQTKWYTLTEKGSSLFFLPPVSLLNDAVAKIGNLDCQNWQPSLSKTATLARASSHGPNINTDIVTDINMNNSNELFSRKQSETDCNSGKKKSRNFQIWFDYEGDCRIHGITQEQLALWKENFPAVDVEQELRSASAWLDGNRTNRKYNVSRFLVNWLSRTQDRAKRISPQNQQVGQNVLLRDPIFAPNERGLKHDS